MAAGSWRARRQRGSLLRARRFQYFHTSQPRSAYLRLNMSKSLGSGALRPAHEVEDENDEQDDHEDSDHSITCSCDSERHLSSFIG